jgi:polyhydroxybutyrate depolymerase
MAAVVACFLGDHIRAAAPAAANRPYWFEPAMGPVGCVGEAAVWTFFGQDETHFVDQDHPGQYGEQQVAFWRAHHGCAEGMGADASEDLPIGAPGECVEYTGCRQDTRYCFYDPEAGHQIPDYFTAEVLGWFRGF